MTKKKRINLFELAENNSPRLQEQYQQLKDNCEETKASLLNDFREKLQEEWDISVNMDDWKFIYWLDTGKYKNIYEVKEVQADELVNKREMNVSEKNESPGRIIKKTSKTIFCTQNNF